MIQDHIHLTMIEAAVQGETAAIEDLLEVCQPDLMKFARKVCASPEDAEDAVQETLWILSRKIGMLRTVSAFAGWMFRIVKNECYRLLRIGQKETELNPEEKLYYFNPDLADETTLKQDVISTITQLPPIYRQVLILRDIEEISDPEETDVLGLTVEAVKSRLHRARLMVWGSLRHWMEFA